MVEGSQPAPGTTNEIDEINEISWSERELISYISLISYAMNGQRPAPAVATRPNGWIPAGRLVHGRGYHGVPLRLAPRYAEARTSSALMALHEETALVDR